MEKDERKVVYGIRGKLISAVAMLLVACIMVVSSTYAWFTLSTAPEVTGISTAVGANGALEMVLLSTKDASGWVYGTNSIPPTGPERNNYWGNLVDLSYAQYGSQAITLYPAILNFASTGKINMSAPVQVPSYGPDGRIDLFEAAGSFGTYENNNFFESSKDYGFRALGQASGLSARQQAFRVAISAMVTAQNAAQAEARDSLAQNGTILAQIAILKAMQTNAEFTQDHVDAIENMITGLENSLAQVEEAYIQAIYAIVLSKSNVVNHASDDAATAAVAVLQTAAENAADGVGNRMTAILGEISEYSDAVIALLPGYSTYTQAVDALTTAKDNTVAEKDAYVWADFRDQLTSLVEIDGIKINGINASEVTDDANKSAIAADILAGRGVTVSIPTGGGIYADVADLTSDYTVEINIQSDDLNVGVDGLAIKARMVADSTADEQYIKNIRETLNTDTYYPADDNSGAQPFSEYYGYVIDLAFRTNAAQSNLLLQVDAADRIYSDNNNEDTMGGGSSMTFTTTAPGFTLEKVKDLMKHIRIVFFDTNAGDGAAEIYAYAKLDVDNAITDNNGVTAKMYIYTEENGVETKSSDNKIVALDQNVEKQVSALVYLDGSEIENKDVAATATQSITGTANFQFASSAELVPMQYGDLYTPGSTDAESSDVTSDNQ